MKKNLLIIILVFIVEILLCFAVKSNVAEEIAKSHMYIDFAIGILGLILLTMIFAVVVFMRYRAKGQISLITMAIIWMSMIVCYTYIWYVISNTPCPECARLVCL